MYQFIVATRSSGTCVGAENPSWSGAGAPTVGDIPTMSFAASGTNKWASRAVVALQLAAWSAVGIVLLEKGVASLQKGPLTPLNVTREITTPMSLQNHNVLTDRIDRISESEPLSVIPIEREETPDKDNKTAPSTDAFPREAQVSAEPSSRTKSEEEIASPRPNSNKFSVNPRQRLDTIDVEKGDEGRTNSEGFGAADESKEPERKVNESEGGESWGGVASDEASWPSPVTIKLIMDDLEEQHGKWESRKRVRVGRTSAGGGAAAAVAMVAVGAVMLVLGPAVIILRALDERRQERRFLKLSGEEDLPPSYEEATSEFDQAPTYSSLNLDSIVTSEAPLNPSNHAEDSTSCTTASEQPDPTARRNSCCC